MKIVILWMGRLYSIVERIREFPFSPELIKSFFIDPKKEIEKEIRAPYPYSSYKKNTNWNLYFQFEKLQHTFLPQKEVKRPELSKEQRERVIATLTEMSLIQKTLNRFVKSSQYYRGSSEWDGEDAAQRAYVFALENPKKRPNGPTLGDLFNAVRQERVDSMGEKYDSFNHKEFKKSWAYNRTVVEKEKIFFTDHGWTEVVNADKWFGRSSIRYIEDWNSDGLSEERWDDDIKHESQYDEEGGKLPIDDIEKIVQGRIEVKDFEKDSKLKMRVFCPITKRNSFIIYRNRVVPRIDEGIYIINELNRHFHIIKEKMDRELEMLKMEISQEEEQRDRNILREIFIEKETRKNVANRHNISTRTVRRLLKLFSEKRNK